MFLLFIIIENKCMKCKLCFEGKKRHRDAENTDMNIEEVLQTTESFEKWLKRPRFATGNFIHLFCYITE